AFNAYAYGKEMLCRAYAVKPGDTLEDLLPIAGQCHVRIDGPNGFMRELRCADTPPFHAEARSNGAALSLTLTSVSNETIEIKLTDESYGAHFEAIPLKPGQSHTVEVSTKAGKQWYDLSVRSKETAFRFAGHIETGQWSTSDPAMA